MNYNFKTQDNMKYTAWNSYVEAHPYGTIFHTSYMFNIYNGTPNHEPFAYFVIDENQDIQAMLSGYIQTVKPGLLGFMSKRAVLFQAPIYNKPDALDFLLKNYLEITSKQAIYTEVRNHYDTNIVKKVFTNRGFLYEQHLNILIDTSLSEEKILKKFSKSARKTIRRVKSKELSFKVIHYSELIEAYKVLEKVYSRINLPLLDLSFFDQAIKNSSNIEKMVIVGAFKKDKLLACRFAFCYKDIVIGFYAGCHEEFFHLNANEFLVYETLKWAHQNRFKIFDFGGAGKPDVPYGVRDYKMKFGGDLVNYGRYHFIHSPLKYKIAENGFRILQKLKKLRK